MSSKRYIPLVGLLVVLGATACRQIQEPTDSGRSPAGISDFTVPGICHNTYGKELPIAVRDTLCK